MSEYVTDTHTLHWHLTKNRRLSTKVAELLNQADAGYHRIFVPSIILVEIVYLIERERIEAALLERLLALTKQINGSYVIAPLDRGTAESLQFIPRDVVPDMPDRIIAATAYQLGLPLLSCDEKIQAVNDISVIW